MIDPGSRTIDVVCDPAVSPWPAVILGALLLLSFAVNAYQWKRRKR